MDFNWKRDAEEDDDWRTDGFYRIPTWQELFEEYIRNMNSQTIFSMKNFKKIPWEKEGF